MSWVSWEDHIYGYCGDDCYHCAQRRRRQEATDWSFWTKSINDASQRWIDALRGLSINGRMVRDMEPLSTWDTFPHLVGEDVRSWHPRKGIIDLHICNYGGLYSCNLPLNDGDLICRWHTQMIKDLSPMLLRPSTEVKMHILELQDYCCAICDTRIYSDEADLDHIWPRISVRREGTRWRDLLDMLDTGTNYQVLCQTCNREVKGSMPYRISERGIQARRFINTWRNYHIR